MSKMNFPKVVKRGHTIVKIYKTPSNGCDSFTVSYYLGQKRQRKTFGNLKLAVTEAETVANKLSLGELDVLTLSSQDRLAYVRAVEALKPTGVPLEMAALQFAEAVKVMNSGSLLEAARLFARQHPQNLPRRSVSEVVEELLRAKVADGMSGVYVQDLRSRLGRFGRYFKMPVSMVSLIEIDDFLRSLELSGRSRNNYRRAIATLLYFSEARGYVVKGAVDVEAVSVAKEAGGAIEIFTPEEMARVLDQAEPALIPFLAIGAFAGLRHAEIARLDWSEIRLADGFIEVKASKAKTASRRLVPIPDNLKEWLAPHQKPNGKVCLHMSMSKQLLQVAKAVQEKWRQETPSGSFKWKHNALRHSFISYRVAAIQNVAQVALEAGNSPQMIFRHYRELVRPADAVKWFSIMPEKPANVVEMVTKAARGGWRRQLQELNEHS